MAPDEPGSAQKTFKIHKEGSVVFSIKNPENKPPGVPSLGPEPEYIEPQRKKLKGYSWIDVSDPSMLDVVGTEVLLVGAREENIAGEVQLRMRTRM